MNQLLEEFEKSFTLRLGSVCTTWQRDVDAKLVSFYDPDLIKWGKEVILKSDEDDKQRLEALRLAWFMEVEEMFYIGDNGLLIPSPGLLNGGFEDPMGKSILVDPMTFGSLAVAKTLGIEKPCKWLMLEDPSKPYDPDTNHSNRTRFTYNRDKLLFKLCWPVRVSSVESGRFTYVGGIAPLALIEEKVDA
jgi:hypothetical protein